MAGAQRDDHNPRGNNISRGRAAAMAGARVFGPRCGQHIGGDIVACHVCKVAPLYVVVYILSYQVMVSEWEEKNETYPRWGEELANPVATEM